MESDPKQPLIAARNAAILVAQAKGRLIRAKESLDFLEHELKQPQFTRRQAIAEVRAKAATYGPTIASGLLSLAQDWEDIEQPRPRPPIPPPFEPERATLRHEPDPSPDASELP